MYQTIFQTKNHNEGFTNSDCYRGIHKVLINVGIILLDFILKNIFTVHGQIKKQNKQKVISEIQKPCIASVFTVKQLF